MQTVILSCLFGVACAMGLWAAVSAQATVEVMMRRGRRFTPDTQI